MRFPIEECRSPEALSPCLPWVDAAVREIYAAEATAKSGESARNFLLAALGKPGSLVLLARDGETKAPAGFLFIAQREDAFLGTRVSHLRLLYTQPERRRLGIARDLLAHAERLLKERGEKTLIAPATHNDDAIISMGERRGYLREREWMIKEL